MENIKETFKIGNVEFAEEGIKIVMPYTKPEDVKFKPIDAEELRVTFNWMKECVKGRLACCTKKLEENITKSTCRMVNGLVYFTDGSHFSKNAAMAMQNIINNRKSFGELNMAEFTQAIKAWNGLKGVRPQNGDIYDIGMTAENRERGISIITEYQAALINLRERACHMNLLSEFDESMANGCTAKEAAKEWDI